MKTMESLKPRIKLWLNGEGVEGAFGDGKCRLLRCIDSTGSLRAASERLGISYRKAWGDLKKAQNALGIVLIEQQRGGRQGGRTTLTEQGKRWLSAYGRFRQDVEAVVQTSFEKFSSEVE
jgi:molybdate transport repressor ModE-like protein